MPAKSYFAELRRRLFERGIMGRPAARLVEELQEHFALTVDEARDAGHDTTTAERMAQAALGSPEAVAISAADNLRQSYWIARHPYFFSVALGFGVLVAHLFFLAGVTAASDYVPDLGPGGWITGEVLAGVMNWTVLLAGGTGLWWLSRRQVLGWKALFLACVGMGVFVSLVGVYTVSNQGLAQNGEVAIFLQDSPLALLVQLASGVTYGPSEIASIFAPSSFASQFFYLHLLAPVGVFFALRYLTPRLRKPAAC